MTSLYSCWLWCARICRDNAWKWRETLGQCPRSDDEGAVAPSRRKQGRGCVAMEGNVESPVGCMGPSQGRQGKQGGGRFAAHLQTPPRAHPLLRKLLCHVVPLRLPHLALLRGHGCVALAASLQVHLRWLQAVLRPSKLQLPPAVGNTQPSNSGSAWLCSC